MSIHVVTAVVARARRRAEEEALFQYIAEHRGEIIGEHENERVWRVNTHVSRLPEYNPPWSRRLLRKNHYTDSKEPPADYLRRVFDSFEFYKDDDFLVARRKEMSLSFALVELGSLTEEREVTLFEPDLTDYERIAEKISVTVHPLKVEYRNFVVGDVRKLEKASLPDVVRFV